MVDSLRLWSSESDEHTLKSSSHHNSKSRFATELPSHHYSKR